MKVTAVLLLALASASAGPLSNFQPVHPRDRKMEQSIESRIIGGQTAQKGQIPYQVGIAFTYGNTGGFCGGSILSNNWVLTAAHCTDGASSAKVYAGSVILKSGEVRDVPSGNFQQHPDYNRIGVVNDISLLKLEKQWVFGPEIQSIGLPSRTGPYDSYEGQTAIVSGWGYTSDLLPIQPWLLQYATVEVISNAECGESYPGLIKPSHLCTSKTSGHHTCSGDSGGPVAFGDAVVGNIQIAIVSFGSSAGCSKAPSGYTRVTYFRDWIYQETGF